MEDDKKRAEIVLSPAQTGLLHAMMQTYVALTMALLSVLTFVWVFFRQAVGHFRDDLPQLSPVLLYADLLFHVEVGLHSLTQHDLREHRSEAVRGRLGFCSKIVPKVAKFAKFRQNLCLRSTVESAHVHGDGVDEP